MRMYSSNQYCLPIKRTFSLFLFINILVCNIESSESIYSYQNVSFKISYDLLNENPLKSSQGLSMYLPIGWLEVGSVDKTKLKEALRSKDNIIPLELIDAYQSKDLSFCIISKLVSKEKNYQFFPKDYIDLLENQFATDKINIANIVINNLNIRQYLITNEKHVIIKLFISSKNNYQIDYIIPVDVYKKELNKIESSMGTIKIKGENK